jgi:DNA-binding response OmpR family regulator
MLAVDDDAVSRFTLCAALKKAFDEPELAENGEAALTLARQHRYDLIILDVMMPGMDGFEVCTRIRQSTPNVSTPVLFVTALKDFSARTRSLATGGNDLMGKPFLGFEIAAKALTLVLRARLRGLNRVSGSADEIAGHGTPAVAWPVPSAVPASEPNPAPRSEFSAEAGSRKDGQEAAPVVLLPPPIFVAAPPTGGGPHGVPGDAPREFSPAFLAYMTACVGDMTDRIAVIERTAEGSARWEMLVRLHLRLKCLAPRIDVPELRPACKLCMALEGLFKKFSEKPANATDSALRTAAIALKLLEDLCKPGVKPDLAEHPPIRILVVDDEPLSRRAVTGALQMAFARPDAAECGETALALAEDREFDLIFMDVIMPQMDGFTACTRIHETLHNRSTPVVFVTALSDGEFRARAAECGGSDFVVKPFVFMEITVKALTFALRGRLEKLKKPESRGMTATG